MDRKPLDIRITSVLATLALAALACNALASAPEPTATPAPTATKAPTATPVPTETPKPTATLIPTATEAPADEEVEAQPAGGDGELVSLEINNQTDTPICFVYISATEATEWGEDQLGTDNTVAAGGTFTITDIPAGIYDLRADDCSHNPLAQEFEIAFETGTYTWDLATDAGSLVVENQTSATICWLYVSATTQEDWGPDQLGDATLPSGESFTVTGIEAGDYDLRANDCDGNTLAQEFGVAIDSAGITWTLEDNETVDLTVLNQSSETICYLYVSPSDSEDWGQDQLDESVVNAGDSFTVFGIPPGSYDLRAESCEGSTLEDYGLDLSTDFEYTVTD